MEDKQQYVSVAQARRLRLLGFDWGVLTYLCVSRNDGDISRCYANMPNNWSPCSTEDIERISEPTLSMAQKWLRDEKNIHIIIGRTRKPKPTFYYRIEEMTDDGYSSMPYGGYTRYEDALSDGFDHVVNMLLEMSSKFKQQNDK